MTDYTHLLDRLTNATGADRELDVEIWLTVTDGSYRKKWNYTHSATGRVCEMDETRDKFGHIVLVPAYSESIDAAMSIVPAHLYWMMAKGRLKPSEPMFAVQIIDPESGIAIVEVEHESLEICVLISALKARASCEAPHDPV